MARKVGIIAYGTEEDRQKVAELAAHSGARSASDWMIKIIRSEHRKVAEEMPFQFSARSLKNLEGVKPQLVDVVKLALTRSEVDFMVVEGVRTRERMMELYGKGRTAAQLAVHGIPASYARPGLRKVTWLRNPFSSKHGTGDAVDLLPAPYDWKEGPQWKQVYDAMMSAAEELGVKIRWGRDWDMDEIFEEKGETDGPHFELV